MLKRKQMAGGPIKLTSGDRAFYAVNAVLLALLALIVIVLRKAPTERRFLPFRICLIFLAAGECQQ